MHPVEQLRLAAMIHDRIRVVPRPYFGLLVVIATLPQSLCVWYLRVPNRMFLARLRMS
jgi:hypothetical protein